LTGYVTVVIIIIIKRKLEAQINRKTSQMRRDDAATAKNVDYSVGLMSMKQKCLQQFPKTEQRH